MDAVDLLHLAVDPTVILKAQGMNPDDWQRKLLLSGDRQTLINCCRGAGKSRTCSALALHHALFTKSAKVLLVSRAQRQSMELFRYVKEGYRSLNAPIKLIKETETQCELENGSRIISLPGREETIRSLQGVTLLIIDEAAKVPDDLYKTVRPMLGVSKGRLIALSTPFGQRGWFWQEWAGEGPWQRVIATWHDCPRLTDEFIKEEIRACGQAWVDQEYNCLFTALEGLVYPQFENCIVDMAAPIIGKNVGGIDWGWRNPFAAVWGVLDKEDVLWILKERYKRETPLHEHTKVLPKNVMWYADPSGPTEINEFRTADFKVLKGYNDIRLGIAAVTARIQTGRLKVLRTTCPNLISEAGLYRYPAESERAIAGENPIDEHNHALGALRYLISKLDARLIAKMRRVASRDGPLEMPTEGSGDVKDEAVSESAGAIHQARPWLSLDNEQLWGPL